MLYNDFVSYKRKVYLILFIAPIVFTLTLLTCYSRFGDICSGSGNINEAVALSSLLFPPVFFLLSFIFLFTREEIFHSWLHFAKWYLPLAGIAIFLSLRSHGGWGFPNIFATELVTMWAAGLFFIISLIIIIYKTISIRRKEKLL